MSRLVSGVIWVVASLTILRSATGAEPTGLEAARRLWQNGRYGEALEAYDAFAKQPGERSPAEAAKPIAARHAW